MRIVESPRREYLRRKGAILFAEAKDAFTAKAIKGPYELLETMVAAVDTFFATVGSPLTSKELMVYDGEVPTSKKMFKTFKRIVDDLSIVFAEQDALGSAIVDMINYNQATKNSIEADMTGLRSMIDAATSSTSIAAGIPIVFMDNFSSYSFIDFNASTTFGDVGFVDTNAGTLVLHRESYDLAIEDGDEIAQLGYVAKAGYIGTGMYSGKMYGVVEGSGESGSPNDFTWAEDGIRLDLSNVVKRTDKVPVTLSEMLGPLKAIDSSNPDALRTMFEYEYVVIENEPNVDYTDIDGKSHASSDYVITSTTRETWLEEVRPGLYTEHHGPWIANEGHPTFGATRPRRLQLTSSFLADSGFDGVETVSYIWGQNPVAGGQVWDKDTFTEDIGNTSLSLKLSVKFVVPKKVSEITITPHLFGKNVAPEVVKIEAFNDQTGELVDIPLTTAFLSATSSEQVVYLDAPKTFFFATMLVSSIHITLVQRRPYRMKFQMYAIEKSRMPNMQPMDTSSKNIWLVDGQGYQKKFELETSMGSWMKEKIDTFPTTPVALANSADIALQELMVEHQDDISTAVWYSASNKLSALLGDQDQEGKQPRRDLKAYLRSWWKPVTIPSWMSNRLRFAIAITDLKIGSSIFAEKSETPSITWRSSYPIGSISLDAREVVPLEFSSYDSTKQWITYYVSVDGGVSFHEIAPMGNPPCYRTENGKRYQVPTIIRVNSDIPADRIKSFPWKEHGFVTSEDPMNVIIRIRMERPPDTASGLFTGMTPRLDYYKLICHPAQAGGVI